MAIEADLNIFISWSGNLAKGVTDVLYRWLPTMFDHVKPWFSEIDIDAGSRGLTAIQERLDVSSFGIIVVTPENMDKPWLVFEAGALSRRLNGDLTKVVPVLVGFDDVSQLSGSPLFQFQAVKLDEGGAKSLCLSLTRTIGLDEAFILTRFQRGWPDLAAGIEAAIEAAGDQPPPPDVTESDLLKGLYMSMRTLEREVVSLARVVNPMTSSAISVLRNQRRYLGEQTNPWQDGRLMQSTQDEISAIASNFRPVRWVSPMEREGQRFLGVMFEDGEGLSPTDFNWFMEQMLKFPVTVKILSDREMNET